MRRERSDIVYDIHDGTVCNGYPETDARAMAAKIAKYFTDEERPDLAAKIAEPDADRVERNPGNMALCIAVSYLSWYWTMRGDKDRPAAQDLMQVMEDWNAAHNYGGLNLKRSENLR